MEEKVVVYPCGQICQVRIQRKGRPDQTASEGLERVRKLGFQEFASLTVALNCGIGSSSLKAELNAFERLSR